ncbi:hypothetical protein KU854_15940 [Enterovibrio sp. NIFS-20-8]|nr:hypothetical protein [Enterovibrio paralichthyis]
MSTSASADSAITKIASKDAAFHEDQDVIACGELKQITRFKRGFYLNLDDKYPHQSLTLVVWEDDMAGFRQEHGKFDVMLDKQVCGKGTVTQYKGRSQMSLYNAFSFKISG